MIPKVSIIVPCYGVEKYLDRCMESLVNQTLKDIEIILVDDKSPDRVPDMCDAWCNKDSRIKVIHKPINEGLGFARNTGLEIATGEYVAFVDSDDFVELDMFEQLYNEAKKSEADVVYSNFFIEDAKGNWHNSYEVNVRSEWNDDNVKDFMLDMVACVPRVAMERRFQMSVWHSIYRRLIIEENIIRFYSERKILSEDLPFQIDFLKVAKKVVYIPDAFYRYCLNGVSLSHTFKVDKFDCIGKLYELMWKQLNSIEGASERLDRFYLGYERARIMELMISDNGSKYSILHSELKRPIWRVIEKRYPISNLVGFQKMFYRIMLIRSVLIQAFFCIVVTMVKRIKNHPLYVKH